MNEHKEHTSQYTAADIQRYVQGKLSAREMHAMEKAALDDPFLADAMEGMQEAFDNHPESLVIEQQQQLQHQFTTRTNSGGRVIAFKPFRYWQAAAASIVVIIVGVWVYMLLSNKESASKQTAVIAKTEELQPAEAVPAPATGKITDTTVAGPTSLAPKTTVPTKPVHDDQNDYSYSKANPSLVPSPVAEKVADVARREDSAKQDNVAAAVAPAAKPEAKDVKEVLAKTTYGVDVHHWQDTTQPQYNNARPRERETELITIAKNSNSKIGKRSTVYKGEENDNLSGFVKGQVTDLHSNPVANAFIQIPKRNNNVLTDKSGFFQIPVKDSVVDVAVNVTGYGTQNFRLLQNNVAVNQLQLQPANAALNEVVVSSAKSKYKKVGNINTYPSLQVHDAEPVTGWVAFDQYVEKNKRVTAGATGNVIVSFEINKKGILSDYQIVQSLSKEQDDEAIRLIKEGPAWQLLKGRKARINVVVRF